jgi:hypothetical protein
MRAELIRQPSLALCQWQPRDRNLSLAVPCPGPRPASGCSQGLSDITWRHPKAANIDGLGLASCGYSANTAKVTTQDPYCRSISGTLTASYQFSSAQPDHLLALSRDRAPDSATPELQVQLAKLAQSCPGYDSMAWASINDIRSSRHRRRRLVRLLQMRIARVQKRVLRGPGEALPSGRARGGLASC